MLWKKRPKDLSRFSTPPTDISFEIFSPEIHFIENKSFTKNTLFVAGKPEPPPKQGKPGPDRAGFSRFSRNGSEPQHIVQRSYCRKSALYFSGLPGQGWAGKAGYCTGFPVGYFPTECFPVECFPAGGRGEYPGEKLSPSVLLFNQGE